MIEPISIEPMRSVDMDAVVRIDQRCYPTPWLPGAYLTELTNRAACYLVARMGQEVVGFAGAWVVGDEGHITTIAVEPTKQRRKIGERLLLALIDEAQYRGATHITLEVRESNRAAQHLYRKYGFREAALRRSYYTDNGENAVVMWADNIRSTDFNRRLRELREKLYHAYLESLR